MLSKIVGVAYSCTAAYHQGVDCDALPSLLGSSHVIRSHKNKNNSNTLLMILLECQEVHITNQKLMSSKVWGQRNFHLRNVPRIYSFGFLMDGINFTSVHTHKFWCFQRQFETMELSQQQCCLTWTSCSVPDFQSGNYTHFLALCCKFQAFLCGFFVIFCWILTCFTTNLKKETHAYFCFEMSSKYSTEIKGGRLDETVLAED